MLPIPFLKYIPKIFRKSQSAITLANKVDIHLNEWKKDIISIPRLIRPDETPIKYIEELGSMLKAGIQPKDSELTKRKKVKTAIKTHKIRGLFVEDVKKIFDAITGYSCAIYHSTEESTWVLTGDGIHEISYWGALGCNNTDSNLGLDLLGGGDSEYEAGNFYIDLHSGINTPVLSYTTLLEIRKSFTSYIKFGYVRLFLGYVNSSGQFTPYVLYEYPSLTYSSSVSDDIYGITYKDGIYWLKEKTGGTEDKITGVSGYNGNIVHSFPIGQKWADGLSGGVSVYFYDGTYYIDNECLIYHNGLNLFMIKFSSMELIKIPSYSILYPIMKYIKINNYIYITCRDTLITGVNVVFYKYDIDKNIMVKEVFFNQNMFAGAAGAIPIEFLTDGIFLYTVITDLNGGAYYILKTDLDYNKVSINNYDFNFGSGSYPGRTEKMTIKGFYKNGYIYIGGWTGANGKICIVNCNTMIAKYIKVIDFSLSPGITRYMDHDKFDNIYVMTVAYSTYLNGSIKVDKKLSSPYPMTGITSTYGHLYVAEDHFCTWTFPRTIRRFSLYNHIIGDFNE